METGWLPDPEAQPYWPDLEALLGKAARRSGNPVLSPGELVWIASDGPMIVGAVTTRHLENGDTELILIAGTRYREWCPDLEAKLCAWSRALGAKRITAGGRKGWRRIAELLGWAWVGETYEKVF